MGHSGYLESCKNIVGAAKTIAQRIRTEIPELRVLGDPPASVVAFAPAHGSPLNVLEVGDALSTGMVLALSIWDDYAAEMLWLDSDYPLTKSASTPGVARGTCPTTSGVPATVEAQSPNAKVVYSNIKFGDIGSTFSASGSSTSTSTASSSSSSTTSPASSGTPSTSTSLRNGPICRGGKFTTATTCRPISRSHL